MKLITISGVDGSGKSTQRQLLESTLLQRGKSVLVFHVIEFSLANRLQRSWQKGQGQDTTGTGKTQSSWWGILFRKLFLFIDLLRFRLYLKKVSPHYDYLLSDRYFYDTLVNIAFLAKEERVHSSLEKLIPRPDCAFYFNVEPEIVMQRERIPEQGRDYLIVKKKLFEQTPLSSYFVPISAGKPLEEVFQLVSAALQERSLL
ncbi:MAG: hypothetical protein ABI747_02610 [Candidatus Moraniibacteriota bacterium]